MAAEYAETRQDDHDSDEQGSDPQLARPGVVAPFRRERRRDPVEPERRPDPGEDELDRSHRSHSPAAGRQQRITAAATGGTAGMKKLLELIVCFIHPLAVVLAWINLAGRSDLSGGKKLVWGVLMIIPIVPFIYVLTSGDLW
jgi:hypothetical protein